MENPEFLNKKFGLDKSPEVKHTVNRRARETGEQLKDPEARTETYLKRLEKLFEEPDEDTRRRNVSMMKPFLYDRFVIKPDEKNFAPYFSHQEEAARRRGMDFSFEDLPQEEKERRINSIREEQKETLDQWVDYLTSDESTYPTWLKYFALRSVLRMGVYDPETKTYSTRYKKTYKPFPDLNSEALGRTLSAIEKHHGKKDSSIQHQDIAEEYSEWEQLAEEGDFAVLYGRALDYELRQREEMQNELAEGEIEGEWRVYKKGSNPQKLMADTANKATGWCFATNRHDAEMYLNNADQYIFFAQDKDGEYTIPRAGITVGDTGITEIHGTEKGQNLAGDMNDIVGEKMKAFDGWEEYAKRANDMEQLTTIESAFDKQEQSWTRDLTKNELLFLYEVEEPIKGFGLGGARDPRIDELREARNIKEDLPVIFECTPDQIVHDVSEVNEHTKAYIGEWSPGIYKTIKQYPNIEYLYESFPDRKIFMETLTTDPSINSPETAKEALDAENIYVYESMLPQTEFSTETKEYDLVQFTVEQLGLPDGATTDEIYQKAKEAGLALCPAEVGPHLRLQYKGRDWKLIAMEQILARDGLPHVWDLRAIGAELLLRGSWARPVYGWDADIRFVFLSPDNN